MKIVLMVLLLLVTLGPPVSAPQQCRPFVFQDVSTEEWSCIRGKLTDKGFSVGSGDRGEITQAGMRGDFELLQKQKNLTIAVHQLPGACSAIERAITETVDSCRNFEKIQKLSETALVKWRIDAPNISKAQTDYPQIVFKRGDTVTVKAGGCVQHGGPGKTWSLYVAPQPGQSPYFYGMIRLPGMTAMARIKDVIDKPYRIPDDAVGSMFLKLGFSDFRFTDNGYWGREGDDGINDQCKDQPNAWIEIAITR